MAGKYILALDQGTTSSRSILFDVEARIVASVQREFQQIYPQPGWVEHNPRSIWESQLSTAREVLQRARISADEVAAIGITNQRETTLLWDRRTGEPVANAIVWQCRRTTALCNKLKAEGLEEEVRSRTGLRIDAYFSATKLQWYFENVPEARARAERGELCFGTVDSWLLYHLVGRHITDYTNACRTMLYNIHEREWDETLLEAMQIPREVLPEVVPSQEVYGETDLLGPAIPVAGMAGDQQAALFGQTAFDVADCKNTYGTGCFMLMNTGAEPVRSENGLVTTIAWGTPEGVEYALEGSIFMAGAVIQWLRDEVGLISSAAESEAVAAQAPDSGGVYIAPAFVGLGAPHWDMDARGVITGLTRGAGRAQIVRAALESISYQSADVLHAMESDAGLPVPSLKVDGGAAANNLLMQHQANVLGKPVLRGQVTETTALGAAFLAGLAVGFWKDRRALRGLWRLDREFTPKWDAESRENALAGWRDALKRCSSSL